MRLTVIFLYNLLTSILGVYTKLFNPSIYWRSLEYLRSLYLQKELEEEKWERFARNNSVDDRHDTVSHLILKHTLNSETTLKLPNNLP